MPSILFICTANRIRSPFAAAYFKELVSKPNHSHLNWDIDSAGTWATPNLPVDPILLELASEWELDLENHRTKQVDRKLLSEYNLILVMEKGQKEALHYEFPQFAPKIFMLTEICAPPYEFPDPQGFHRTQMRKCLNEIANFLASHYQEICNIGSNFLN